MVERVRHLKRGTEYEVLGEAEAQVSTDGFGPSSTMRITDGSKMTVYRGDDRRLWVRWTPEFRDGRFETIAADVPRLAPDTANTVHERYAVSITGYTFTTHSYSKPEPGRIAYEARFDHSAPRTYDVWDRLTADAKQIWAHVESECWRLLSSRGLSTKERRAIRHITEYLRDSEGEPFRTDDDQIIASAPPLPPDGGSPGMITFGDLRAVVEAAQRLDTSEAIDA